MNEREIVLPIFYISLLNENTSRVWPEDVCSHPFQDCANKDLVLLWRRPLC